MNNNIKIIEWYAQNGVKDIISKSSKPNMQTKSNQNKTNTPKIRLKTTKDNKVLFNNAAAEARDLADQSNTLEDLKKNLDKFDGCPLKKTATNTVFADGQKDAKIMLIGEAPGANEDLEGRPFCGESGKLLDTIFLSIDISREKNLYITNTIFWRPPGNRRPTEQEMQCCIPFLEKHISLIKPHLIILAGSTACNAILANSTPISKQRQKGFSYKNQYLNQPIETIVIFHPSYLLRQPSQKKAAWQDMLFIKTLLKNKK